MKRKCNFRRQAVVPEVSKNQGSFQGIFYFIPFRKIAVNTFLHAIFREKAKRDYGKIYN
jgi:hypothetical protein